jgi:hypothetical protein
MSPTPFLAGCLMLAASAIALSAPLDSGAGARQAPSCGEWVVNREKSTTLALGNSAWLLGYLSGIGVGSGKDFLSGNDNASLYQWMDHYCRTNPLRDVGAGGNALAAELSGKKGRGK